MPANNTGYPQFVYPQLPTADQQQPSTLDHGRLEAFRKNWEYYKRNPQVTNTSSGVNMYQVTVIVGGVVV